MANPNENKKSQYRVWIIALIVLILVLLTAIPACNSMGHSDTDEDVINLIPESSDSTKPTQQSDGEAEDPSETEKVYHPQSQVADRQKIWKTQTEVEVFKISYEDGTENITVAGRNGEKVIAPGTENQYFFRLKNNGDCALDYTVTVEAWFEPEDVIIPVEAKMKSYSGWYMVGGKDENDWDPVLELDGAHDSVTLGVNRYVYYYLDWRWPFESGDDEYDTLLGDTALTQDLTLNLKIKTVATENLDVPPDYGATGIPETGDSSHVGTFTVLLAASGAALLILLFVKKKRKEEENADENPPIPEGK